MPAGLPALPTRVLGPRITKYNAALENSLYLSTHQRVGGARTGARPRARRELGWLEGGHAEEPAAAHAAVRDGARLRGLGAPEAHHHAPARGARPARVRAVRQPRSRRRLRRVAHLRRHLFLRLCALLHLERRRLAAGAAVVVGGGGAPVRSSSRWSRAAVV